MSELKEQQTVALERLCAQFEREQRQHAEQVERQAAQIEALQRQVEQQAAQIEASQQQIEALQQRIERQDAESGIWRRHFERLDGQVTRLAQDYSELNEILRELLR